MGAGRSHAQPALAVAGGGWSGLLGPQRGSRCQGYSVHRAGGVAKGRGRPGFLEAGRRLEEESGMEVSGEAPHTGAASPVVSG